MIIHIMEKEIRDIVGSTKFAVTFTICSILIILSFYIGVGNYSVSRSQYEASKTANTRQYDGITDWTRVQSFRIFLPPQPLAALVNGVSNDIGRTVEVRGRGELNSEESRYGDDPIFAVFRFLDLDFIFSIVLSLFAILFGYDTISGEKERGTLRLTFSNAISRTDYIIGKFLGAFLAMTVPLLLPILLGLLLLPLYGISMSAVEWVSLALIVGAGLSSTGVFLALSIFISSRTERSSTSFLVLLSAWIFLVLIIPKLSVPAADLFVTVPSVDEINSQKSSMMSQLWNEDRTAINKFTPTDKQDMQKIMNEFNKFMQDLGDEREKRFNEFAARLNEDRQNRQAVQQTLAVSFSALSPSALFRFAASEAAGTSLRLEKEFLSQAKEYQRQYAAFMKEKTGMNTGGFSMVFRMSNDDNAAKPKPIDINELPQFNFSAAGIGGGAGIYSLSLSILGLFMALYFFGAFVSFKTYDVR